MTHPILRPPAGRTLLLAALMVAALLIGHTGTARALTVTVDGFGTYELSTFSGTYNDNVSTIQAQPWWTGDSNDFAAADAFADAAFAAAEPPNKTVDGAPLNLFAYGPSEFPGNLVYSGINRGNRSEGKNHSSDNFQTTFVTATEVTPVPEIDGAVLAQLALVLGTLWLVFGVGRRGDGDTPAA